MDNTTRGFKWSLLFVAVQFIVNFQSVQGGVVAPCANWTYVNGSSSPYLISHWDGALASWQQINGPQGCKSKHPSGRLAISRDNFVWQTITKFQLPLYLGLQNVNSNWVWIDGTPWNGTTSDPRMIQWCSNFNYSSPGNQSCAEATSCSGANRIQGSNCLSARFYVCEVHGKLVWLRFELTSLLLQYRIVKAIVFLALISVLPVNFVPRDEQVQLLMHRIAIPVLLESFLPLETCPAPIVRLESSLLQQEPLHASPVLMENLQTRRAWQLATAVQILLELFLKVRFQSTIVWTALEFKDMGELILEHAVLVPLESTLWMQVAQPVRLDVTQIILEVFLAILVTRVHMLQILPNHLAFNVQVDQLQLHLEHLPYPTAFCVQKASSPL
jgi:hypothetical protein